MARTVCSIRCMYKYNNLLQKPQLKVHDVADVIYFVINIGVNLEWRQRDEEKKRREEE